MLSGQRSKTGSLSQSLWLPDKMEKAILLDQTFSNDNIIKGFYPIGSEWNNELINKSDVSVPMTYLHNIYYTTISYNTTNS